MSTMGTTIGRTGTGGHRWRVIAFGVALLASSGPELLQEGSRRGRRPSWDRRITDQSTSPSATGTAGSATTGDE